MKLIRTQFGIYFKEKVDKQGLYVIAKFQHFCIDQNVTKQVSRYSFINTSKYPDTKYDILCCPSILASIEESDTDYMFYFIKQVNKRFTKKTL